MIKAVEERLDDLSADVAAMVALQAVMIAQSANQMEEPLQALHRYSNGVSAFINAMPLSDFPHAEAVRERMLRSAQRTMDSAAQIMANAF